ncbi:MAG: dpnA [Segetibacter sp.]|nr:dpnA [Segetibacter sp.]
MVSEAVHMNNMEYMAKFPDNFFDLACVDPEYGININMNMGRRKGEKKKHTDKSWDKQLPPPEYFVELFRVSKNQIIWGGNYFDLPPTGAWIYWDKGTPDGVSFADGELAWTSFDRVLRKAKIPYSGFVGKDLERIHPTQKPIALYKWVFTNYNGEGQIKVIDTHLGSGSSRIAAYELGIDFYSCELDGDYFEKHEKRFKKHISQQQLFTPVDNQHAVQLAIAV